MKGKKILILTFGIFLIFIGSAVIYFFLSHNVPKKTPLRAKQVILIPDCQVTRGWYAVSNVMLYQA